VSSQVAAGSAFAPTADILRADDAVAALVAAVAPVEGHEDVALFDADGRVLESFTPDFYLPEFDLYLELTTMKQSLVTKKNRKVRLLRELYPKLNIQVFYQKDFENLIFKYGLADRPVEA